MILGKGPIMDSYTYRWLPYRKGTQSFGELTVYNTSTLAWRIPGTEEPGGLESIGLHKVRHDWSALACTEKAEMGLLFSPGETLLLPQGCLLHTQSWEMAWVKSIQGLAFLVHPTGACRCAREPEQIVPASISIFFSRCIQCYKPETHELFLSPSSLFISSPNPVNLIS